MPQSGLLISLFLLISTHSVLVSLFSTKQVVPSNSTRCHSFHFLSSPPKVSPSCLTLPCLVTHLPNLAKVSSSPSLVHLPSPFNVLYPVISSFSASRREQREGERTGGFVKSPNQLAKLFRRPSLCPHVL
ncbi:hypothetical protein CORC01_13772 [Colletotrichum orchidophilum]|uniref:Secreted protein n=1 Tax=Colletotrichum orchidophilum TaxID=1209926 RepID=A0A1G4AP39_9PEZI|nr:uncharacterized protein CORC01_13772 [Colletotrichum orchidophilum]OHE90917.1 hypothetical protein CORC01_13772 [Colletotrichum orchidophilum]